MQRPSSPRKPQDQAAWTILVVGIVLYDLGSIGDRLFEFRNGDISNDALIDGMPGELIYWRRSTLP
jgi:hypothetical protein